MFQLAGDIVKGGWDAISNLAASAGKGMAEIGSAFFPAPQRTEVKHLPIEEMGGTGQTYRPTAPENESMNDTFSYFMKDWVNTPYEMQYAIPKKIAESKELNKGVSMTAGEWLGHGLDWALETSKKVGTIVETWDIATGRKTTATNTEGKSSGPTTTSTQKRTVTETGNFAQRGAEVIEKFKAAAGNILTQAKGLFNLGFEGTGGKSPVFSIQHELDPGTKLAVGSTGVVVLLLLAFILFKEMKK